MALPPVFQARSIYNGFWAVPPSLVRTSKSVCWGTRRAVGQFIPQYRTDGQYWIDHTKTWACGRKGQSAETPLRRLCQVAPRSFGDPAEAVEREGPGLWGKTGQRPLERSACRALLVIARKPATKVRFWHETDTARCPTWVPFRGKSGS